jgi:KDO2-lipid IV(A) lauroyltransferase
MTQKLTRAEIIKQVRYFAEFCGLLLCTFIFQLMPTQTASKYAGIVGRTIGPRLAASRKAIINLKMALPGKTDKEYREIVTGMWDNLARLIVEYHELEFFAPDMEVMGIEHLQAALAKGQVILFSGHIGNWELMAPYLLASGRALDLVYRAPNNPWSDKLLSHYRSLSGKLVSIPKSRTGMRQLIEHMKEGRSVGMLIDQKYNEGIAVPFFGHPAMTSPAFAQLAQKFDCPLVPFRVERIKDTEFCISFFEPLKTKDKNGENLPVETVIAEAHALLEDWIRERPEQWLWLHRRWIDQKNPGKKAAAKMSQARSQGPKKPAA